MNDIFLTGVKIVLFVYLSFCYILSYKIESAKEAEKHLVFRIITFLISPLIIAIVVFINILDYFRRR